MKKYKINVMKWNLEKYNTTPLFYQKFQILLLMENANTHLVSIFKDYLLYDDSTEFFKEFYSKKEIYPRLKTIYDYYESSSYLFPNYTAINEGKYIYRNIIRKQKLIDYLEDLEDKKKEKEEKKNMKKKKKSKNINQDEQSSSCIEVFDTKIYENIRKETENDSKINELFCVGNKNNANDCDSFSSILKLTEELKEREKEIDNKKNNINKEKEINYNTSREISNNNTNKKSSNNNNSNNNSNTNNNKRITYNLDNLNETEGKIYVSRRVSLNQNTKVYNKKTINKGVKNLNINNFINNNNSGLIMRNFNLTDRNKNSNKINIDTSKSNEFLKNSQNNFNSNKNIKNNYKKNNIIINIINSNKNNNYNSTNNYFPNYTNPNSNNTNTNTNENNNNQNNNVYFNNLSNIKTDNNKNSNFNTNSNPRINTENRTNNNTTIGGSLNSKGTLAKPQSSNHNNNNKNNQKNKTKQIKSKLLSFRLTDSNFVKNLAERIKNKANSSSIKKVKNKSKTKSIFSPNTKNINNNNNNNMKKRTKTEILGNNTDIFIFGQQGDNNQYSNSINRQILKNINLTNTSKPHKEISLVNKKIINYHLNINNNNNNNNTSNSNNKKCIKHTSTNSQNLTDVKIINKMVPFTSREIIKKKGVMGVFSVNKTERTSRNHSKDKMNKINNTTVKKNYLDSFSPKKTQDLIYNKIHKIQNKKNDSVYTFLKSISSNKKIKNLKIKKNNYSSINSNANYQGINSIRNNKEIHKRINSGKNY